MSLQHFRWLRPHADPFAQSLVDDSIEEVVFALVRAVAAGEADEVERLCHIFKAEYAAR